MPKRANAAAAPATAGLSAAAAANRVVVDPHQLGIACASYKEMVLIDMPDVSRRDMHRRPYANGGNDMRLQEIMNTRVVTAGPDESADAAWLRMRDERIRHLVVVDGTRLVGMLSARDLGIRRGEVGHAEFTVGELMAKSPASATPAMTLRQAANLMRGRVVGSLPVVDDGRVVGIVTATDVLEELGRGATRPVVRAQRRAQRLPPASTRRVSSRKGAAPERRQATTRGPIHAAAMKAGAQRSAPVSGRNSPALARERVRKPDSPTRAPLSAALPRAAKRTAQGRSPATTPAFIHSFGSLLDAADRDYLRRKLGRRLGKFVPAVQRVSVRLEDANGPNGGVDKHCRIKVTLRELPAVVVEAREASTQAAMDGALAKLGSAVKRPLQRRLTRARRPRDRRAPVSG